MKTAVIYARYSSDSQTEQSIEGQLRVCQDYAKQNDILVVDAYIDRAMSGTNDNRPAFQKMIHDSEKQKWTYVIVYKLDRFARNKYESVINKKRLQDNGVKLVSAMENITDSPEGRMMECFLEGMNQYFSEELTQKVRRGLNESWLKGNATGGPKVFGYDIINKKYVINEREATIIQEVFTKYSQGFTAMEIAESLKERGLRYNNDKFMDHKTVFKLLHKLKYTGKVIHNGTVYDKVYPQIISDELWQKIKMIHEDNKINPSSRKAVYEYILTGKLVCGVCHKKMSGASGSCRAKRVHYYYVCTSHKHGGNCTTTSVQKDYLENLVINTTLGFLTNDAVIDKIANSVYSTLEKTAKDNSQLKTLESRKTKAQNAANNLISALEQGIITEQTKIRLQELEKELNQLEYEIAKEKARNQMYLTKEQVKKYIKSKIQNQSNSFEFRKMIVNTFIREIIFFEDKLIITYNFSDHSEPVSFDVKAIKSIERQSQSDSAFSFIIKDLSNITNGAPKILVVRRGFFCLSRLDPCIVSQCDALHHDTSSEVDALRLFVCKHTSLRYFTGVRVRLRCCQRHPPCSLWLRTIHRIVRLTLRALNRRHHSTTKKLSSIKRRDLCNLVLFFAKILA